MEYGIQMYSVRDVAQEDFQKALQTVAELGYRYVEFAGFFNHPRERRQAVAGGIRVDLLRNAHGNQSGDN